MKGHPTLIFFGFTHCPDVCPTTLFEMSEVLRAMGKDADRVNAYYISVDPERDTTAAMKDYLSSFDPRLKGLTGSPEEIAKVLSEYRVYAKKVPLKDGDYTMDHTALIYLMDRDGKFVVAVQPQPQARGSRRRPQALPLKRPSGPQGLRVQTAFALSRRMVYKAVNFSCKIRAKCVSARACFIGPRWPEPIRRDADCQPRLAGDVSRPGGRCRRPDAKTRVRPNQPWRRRRRRCRAFGTRGGGRNGLTCRVSR